jgi:glutathione S-transferase
MLMLEHKQVPYRRVEFVTLLHPLGARLRGFEAGGETRSAGGKRPFGLRLGDRLGTVPGLAADGERISTNHRIARFLDERHSDPPLFPADPARRAAVEEAERWANETLQMAARRLLVPRIVGGVFATGRSAERDPVQELPALLDRIDAWIAEGVLGGPELNAADFMVAPSLALILYRPDVMPMFEGRPALGLVDRLLPAAA